MMAKTTDAPPGRGDAFPTTQSTFLSTLIGGGRAGSLEAGRHVMRVYAQPLRVYLTGSSFRDLGDPDELVEGFFADRLGKETFLRDWVTSGRRFRYWLIRAFKNFLMEQARASKKWKQAPQHSAQATEPEHDDDPETLFHRATALELVREALRLAEEDCRSAGQQKHWEVFVRHHVGQQSYQVIAEAFGVTPVRIGVMTRTAANKFKARLRELVAWSSACAEDVDQEIQALTETLGP